jgi:hypothetical protein
MIWPLSSAHIHAVKSTRPPYLLWHVIMPARYVRTTACMHVRTTADAVRVQCTGAVIERSAVYITFVTMHSMWMAEQTCCASCASARRLRDSRICTEH